MARLTVGIQDSDHILGPENAPVKLVEYGDFQCPYCGAAYPILQKIIRQMGDRLCFVYRNFPLTELHPCALDAARAAEAAGLQGQFWEMHDLLYLNQDRLDLESLAAYARALDLDLERFAADFAGLPVEARIESDVRGGESTGVRGTPTFFVNGERVTGDWSYPALLAQLDRDPADLRVSGR